NVSERTAVSGKRPERWDRHRQSARQRGKRHPCALRRLGKQVKVHCQEDSLNSGEPEPRLCSDASNGHRGSSQKASNQNASYIIRRDRPKKIDAEFIEGAKDNRDDARAKDCEEQVDHVWRSCVVDRFGERFLSGVEMTHTRQTACHFEGA